MATNKIDTLVAEVDNYKTSDKTNKKVYKWDIVWINVFLLGALHAIAIYGMYMRYCSVVKRQTIIFAKCTGMLAAVGTTAGAHRLWTHKSYTANIPMQILLAAMMTLSYQNSIYIWCRDHRLHHKHSETDADPHNAKRGLFFSHVGWLLVRKHKDVIAKGKYIDMSDLRANPVVMFQHKYYYYLVSTWGFIMPTFVCWYIWDEVLLNSFISSIISYTITVNLIWCINSLAHYSGNKPYDSTIGATENGLMKYIGVGEGFHNYHHTFPWDYKASEFGFEGRNITAGFIDFFAKIGWATNLKEAPKKAVETKANMSGDGSWTSKPYINHLKNLIYFGIFLLVV